MLNIKKVEKTITNESEILGKLKEIIKPYLGIEIDLDQLKGDEHLIDDLKINSAHIVDIIIDIESAFDIIIDDDSINQMDSVNDSIKVIKEQISK